MNELVANMTLKLITRAPEVPSSLLNLQENPFKGFQEALTEATKEAPKKLATQSFSPPVAVESESDLVHQRKRMAEQISRALLVGDEAKVVRMQEEYAQLNQRIRRLVDQSFDDRLARLNQPSKEYDHIPHIVGKFARKESAKTQTSELILQDKEIAKPIEQDNRIEESKKEVSLLMDESVEGPANPFGVSSEVWQKVTKDERLSTALQSMPEKAINLYQATSFEEKREIAKRINQKTHVFLFTIDNRRAFIDGTAMGRNTFDYLDGMLNKQMDEAMTQGTVSVDDILRQKTGISILRTLSPEQREGYLRLLETETKTKTVAVN